MNEQSWEVYSKILSQSNVKLQYSKDAITACYDRSKNTITIPVYKFLDNDATQLLVSHEVGHALFSTYTSDELSKYFEKYGDLFNVIEDAYIERMIKKEYQGLHEIFKRGYTTIAKNDFFKLKGKNINDLNLVDRLNIYTKVGFFYDVEFRNSKESEFSYRIMYLNSNKDVLQLCEDIYQYLEGNVKKTIQKPSEDTKDENPSSGSDDVKNDNTNDSDAKKMDREAELLKAELTDTLQKSFNESAIDLRKEEMKKFLNAPSGCNTYNFVSSDFDRTPNLFKYLRDFEKYFREDGMWDDNIINNIKNLAMYASTIFQQKKSANEMKTARFRKVGKIDMKKVSRYSVSENIFRQMKMMSEGKNHGIVILLDGSGSMDGYMHIVVYQAAILAEFCKLNDIPFEIIVFGLSWKSNANMWNTSMWSAAILPVTKLCNSLNYSLGGLLGFSSKKNDLIAGYDTPTVNGIIAASQTLEKMKQSGIEKTSLFIITDGEFSNLVYTQKNQNKNDRVLYEKADSGYVSKIMYDGIEYDIKSYIQDDYSSSYNWIVELLLAKIKETLGTYISVTFLSNLMYELSMISKEMKNHFCIAVDRDNRCDFACSDSYMYCFKHGYFFENKQHVKSAMKYDESKLVYSYKFKNNPFIDLFQLFDISGIIKLDAKIKLDYDNQNADVSALTNIIVYDNLMKLFVNMYVNEIS